MKRCFIFDLDGVIVDTAKYHFICWKQLADDLGIPFTEKENELLKGVSRVNSLELILKLGNQTMVQEKKDRFLKEKNDNYLSYIKNMTNDEILPGVAEFIAILKTKKIPTALGSASKNARTILDVLKIDHWFDVVVDGTNVTKAKPDPEVFLQGAQLIGVPASQCIVFEDSVAGVQAANKADMISVGIGKKETLHEAQYCYTGFDKMEQNFIEKLLAPSLV